MRHARALGLAGITVLAAAAVAFAQTSVEPLEENPPVEVAQLEETSALDELAGTHAGNADNGATLAATCAACHGVDGNPPEGLPYPRIAGQSERYIAQQLAVFKSGERNTGLAAAMIPFATMLSAQDMRDVGAYFATKTAGAGIADDTVFEDGAHEGLKFYEIGERLFLGGDAARGIPACMACHGPAGGGNPGPAYPAVAGQEAAYVDRRLQEYRAGTTEQQDRRMFDIMATISASLTDQEIQSLASYLQGLHERPDAATLAAIEAAGQAGATAPAPAAPEPEDAAPVDDTEPAPAEDAPQDA